jgi:hypothetical protein
MDSTSIYGLGEGTVFGFWPGLFWHGHWINRGIN